MKPKNTQVIQRNQVQQQLSQLLGFPATTADLKIINAYLVWFQKFPKVFPSEQTIGQYAGEYSCDTVQRAKKKADGKVLDWTRKDHAPTPTYFWLLDANKTERFKILFPLVFGFQHFKIFKNPLFNANAVRVLKLTALATITLYSPDASGTPRRPSGMTWGEIQCRQHPPIPPDGSKNNLNWQERESIFSYRPASTGTVSRSGFEATPQKHQNLYPQKGKYDGSTQSDTTIHSGDNRTLTEQVGADKTGRISGDSYSRGPERITAQQSGSQPLCPVYEDSVGALQDQQPYGQLEAGGLSQGDLPDAGECPDALGYEGDWSEVYD